MRYLLDENVPFSLYKSCKKSTMSRGLRKYEEVYRIGKSLEEQEKRSAFLLL